MATIVYHGPQKLEVKDYGEDSVHTLREMTDLGYEAEKANEFARNVGDSLAPHYHKQAVDVEKHVRETWNTKFPGKEMADAAVAEVSYNTFSGLIQQEVDYLKKEKGWDGKNLPKVNHQAVRRILSGWEFGGSMLVLTTCSAAAKFAADAKKAINEAAAEDYKKSAGIETVDLSTGHLELPADVAEVLPEFLASLEAAVKANKAHALSSLGKARRAMDNIVATSLSSVSQRAVDKSKAA